MTEFIFWQEYISIHQIALLRELSIIGNNTVKLIITKNIDKKRLLNGWYIPDLGNIKIIEICKAKNINDNLLNYDGNSVNIFSGWKRPEIYEKYFQIAYSKKCIIGIQCEAFNYFGAKGLIRFVKAKIIKHHQSQKIDFILAISKRAVNFYDKIGFPDSKLFLFAYFVDLPKLEFKNKTKIINKDEYNIIFIGSDYRRKGVDILIKALKNIKFKYKLHMFGKANSTKNIEQIKNSSISDKISYHGAIDNRCLISIIRDADLLVLPSRWDGWGAVVNEALLCGVPAIVSNRCGAADLICNSKIGSVYKYNAINELEEALRKWIEAGKISCLHRKEIISYAKKISPKSGAEYLHDISLYLRKCKEKPVAPWIN